MNNENDEFDYKFEILKQEIEILQNRISNYDTHLLTIRGWAVTIFSAFVIFSAQYNRPPFLIFSIFAILLFWFIDSLFKSFQFNLTDRFAIIENYLNSQDFLIAIKKRHFQSFEIPGINKSYSIAKKERINRIIKISLLPSTAVLYVSMIVITLGLFVFLF